MAVTMLLSHTQASNVPWTEANDPRVMEEHSKINKDIILHVYQMVKHDKQFWNLINLNWVWAQMQDLVLCHVINWIKWPKADKRTLDKYLKARRMLEVDQWFYAQWQKDFLLKDNLLFLNITLANSMETISVFVVPAQKHQATTDGCHQSASHQGWDRTLSLMKERFWWPRMAQALVMAVTNCGHCKQFKAKPQILGMQPIICTEPMELVHVNYVWMEVTISPKTNH